MIDFTNKSIIKLRPLSLENGAKEIELIKLADENVVFAFEFVRDKLIFTNKRIISINVQGITGKKVDYTSMPYSKIQLYSVETAGTFDLDSELDIVISGVGTIKFELSTQCDIKSISKLLSEKIL